MRRQSCLGPIRPSFMCFTIQASSRGYAIVTMIAIGMQRTREALRVTQPMRYGGRCTIRCLMIFKSFVCYVRSGKHRSSGIGELPKTCLFRMNIGRGTSRILAQRFAMRSSAIGRACYGIGVIQIMMGPAMAHHHHHQDLLQVYPQNHPPHSHPFLHYHHH